MDNDFKKEYSDSLRANQIVFEFTNFKTPSTLLGVKLPRNLFFTFKFYSFRPVQTEVVELHRREDLMSNDMTKKEIVHSTPYCLVTENIGQHFN